MHKKNIFFRYIFFFFDARRWVEKICLLLGFPPAGSNRLPNVRLRPSLELLAFFRASRHRLDHISCQVCAACRLLALLLLYLFFVYIIFGALFFDLPVKTSSTKFDKCHSIMRFLLSYSVFLPAIYSVPFDTEGPLAVGEAV